jgi:hypothetical protein
MTTLVVSGTPGVLTLSGGRAADFDELVLRRLAGPFGTYDDSPDISVERFKRARLEECRIDESFVNETSFPELFVHADVIEISSCVFCDETRMHICGDEITVEDSVVKHGLLSARDYSFTRCAFIDVVFTLVQLGGSGSTTRFRDCVFDRASLIAFREGTLEFTGCSWYRLEIRHGANRNITLRVDGRALDLGDDAALRQHNIARW